MAYGKLICKYTLSCQKFAGHENMAQTAIRSAPSNHFFILSSNHYYVAVNKNWLVP